MKTRRIALALLLTVVLVVSLAAGQSIPRSLRCFNIEQRNAWADTVELPITGARLLDVCLLSGFYAYTIGSTVERYGVPCENVRVFKTAPDGRLSFAEGLFSGYACTGDILIINSTGTGTYAIYGFRTANPNPLFGLGRVRLHLGQP